MSRENTNPEFAPGAEGAPAAETAYGARTAPEPNAAAAAGAVSEACVELIRRIRSGEAMIAVVGLGYVGLPLAHAFHAIGLPVIGLDIDEEKIRGIEAGESYFSHFDSAKVRELAESHYFMGTTDFSAIGPADAILLCVPTPLGEHREPDLSYVENTARAVGEYLREGHLVVLESTTYPGTTDELLRGILQEESGLVADRDFLLAYSPEREDPGNLDFETSRIPKVVGADCEAAREAAVRLYEAMAPAVVPVSSSRTAEAVKLVENIFRSANIALVNELKVVFERMNIDIFEVIDAAKTKPFGYMPFYPGPGLGGHCIPIDPFYLTWKAREYGLQSSFIELSGTVNNSMPAYVVQRTIEALNDGEKSLRGSRVLCVGLAYKPDVDDIRESPSFEIIKLLAGYGAHVDYYDPYVPEIPKTRKHPDLAGRRSVAFDRETVSSYDAAIIITNHRIISYEELIDWAQCVVDTRGATRGVEHNGTPVWSA